MGIVRFALRFPHTFYVLAALILFLGIAAIRSMPTDIFPEINIPVISIIWNYNGLAAQEMGQRIAAQNERGLTTTVSDIEHIESQSLRGTSVIKIYFQPGADVNAAVAEVTAICQTLIKPLPPGSYRVFWKVLSVDTHTTEGNFSFTVGQ